MLSANIIDFDNQWVSLRWSQGHDIVDYPLLEWHTSWVHAVDATNFNNKLQGILSDFGVLVGNPLASEFGQLLVVLSNYYLKRLVD